MTISKQKQTDNINDALRVILDVVGDEHLDGALFELNDSRFRDIITTTWEHLEASGCLKQVGMWHRLTSDGWIRALQAAGRLCDPKMKEKLGRLCARIKRRCEEGGVRHRTGVTIQELSEDTGFSEGWISNVIESHLIRMCFQQEDCEWEPGDYNKNYVMIPARFGLDL
jgi:hypothetical protein